MPNRAYSTQSLIVVIMSLYFLSACQNLPQSKEERDLTKKPSLNGDSVPIGAFYLKPQKSFEFNSLGDIQNDTFTVVSCSDYVFSPFGTLSNKSQIAGSLLKKFTIINRVDTIDNGVFEFQILKYDSSKLILFFDHDSFASRSSYVFDGDIKDSDLSLANGIRIGMSKVDFIKLFFEKFPNELLKKYDIIAFESCVQDIRHTYIFKNGKLETICFRSHSYWKVKYG